MTYSAPVVRAPMAVQRPEDAHVLLARLETSMEGLIELIEAETKLVRDGKLFAAAELEDKKTEYARAYVELMESAKAQEQTLRTLLPQQVDKLRVRHEEFRALLQMNLAALKTARDVTRNLVQGVARRMGQVEAPQTYGSAGTLTDQRRVLASGVALDRSY
ncbi:MAG: flagellar protein FlgN [Pseudomonadota bacterium]